MKALIAIAACLYVIGGFSAPTADAEYVPEIYFNMIAFECFDTYCVCNGARDCYNMGRSGVCKGELVCVDETCTCEY